MTARRNTRIAAALAAVAAVAVIAAPAASAATTIGVDVNQAFNYTGACTGGAVPANQPCTVVNRVTTPARTMQSPCDGTVVRFRLNGIATATTYRLRVVHDNGNGTFTPVATSSPPVTLTAAGVTEFPTSLPIKAGEYTGIDFMDNPVPGLRGFGGAGFLENVFYAFPADGTPDTPFDDAAIYLYNADVECGGAGEQPAAKKCKKKRKKGKKKSAAAAKKKKKGCKKKKKKK